MLYVFVVLNQGHGPTGNSWWKLSVLHSLCECQTVGVHCKLNSQEVAAKLLQSPNQHQNLPFAAAKLFFRWCRFPAHKVHRVDCSSSRCFSTSICSIAFLRDVRLEFRFSNILKKLENQSRSQCLERRSLFTAQSSQKKYFKNLKDCQGRWDFERDNFDFLQTLMCRSVYNQGVLFSLPWDVTIMLHSLAVDLRWSPCLLATG